MRSSPRRRRRATDGDPFALAIARATRPRPRLRAVGARAERAKRDLSDPRRGDARGLLHRRESHGAPVRDTDAPPVHMERFRLGTVLQPGARRGGVAGDVARGCPLSTVRADHALPAAGQSEGWAITIHRCVGRNRRGGAILRAAAYHRVSTTEQNPDAARAELGDYVRARKWELVLDVVEAGSGARSDRPGLHQVLEAVRRRRVDVVVVWKLDRVGRSVVDLLGFMRTLDAAGVRLVCMTQNIDTHDAMGRFAFTVLAAAAELELEH